MGTTEEKKGDRYTVRIQDGDITLPATFVENAGGRVAFYGIVRPSESGDSIDALDYDAYVEMALSSMEKIALEAIELYDPLYVYAVHRTGLVKTGEPSVLVDVSCGHRGEAFKACSLIIDRIKKEVPIWKKVVFSDGTGKWKEEIDQDKK